MVTASGEKPSQILLTMANKEFFKSKVEDFLHNLMQGILNAKHSLLASVYPQCIATFNVSELPARRSGQHTKCIEPVM